MDIVAMIAERRIQEAIRRGEFDNLALAGQPLPRENDRDVPAELRLGYKILKNAGMIPPELEARREILTLRDLLLASTDAEERRELRKSLGEKELRYRLLMEQRPQGAALRQYEPRIKEKLGI